MIPSFMHLNIHTYDVKIPFYHHSHLWWCVCMFASWEHHHLYLDITVTSSPKCCIIFIFSFECVSIFCLNIANQGSSSSEVCVQKLNGLLTQPLCLDSSNNGWCKIAPSFSYLCVFCWRAPKSRGWNPSEGLTKSSCGIGTW
jgi:hypothetical protein